MSKLHPLHFSIAGSSRRPSNMERITLGRDQIEVLERVALDIFADMTNAGHPFQKALSAIYLSGLQNGASAERPRTSASQAPGRPPEPISNPPPQDETEGKEPGTRP